MLSLTNFRLAPGGPEHGSLDLEAGAVHVVLGRNGSGKTALCRLLAGLPGPASGTIEFAGKPWDKLPPQQRSVAMVYQAFVNYPHWTVAENLASPLQAKGVAAAEQQSTVADLVERLQLPGLEDRLPAELSGGQQQRLAIGRALAKQANLLLLDEPLVNLDYKLREALEDELLTLLANSGATVLYTSSDPKDALALASNVVLLANHAVIQTGNPVGVYQAPVNAVAADLLSDPGVNRVSDTQCYIRPEHLQLLESPDTTSNEYADASNRRTFDMQVAAVETNGSQTFVQGLVGSEHWVATLNGLPAVTLGQTVTLACRAADILDLPGSSDAAFKPALAG